MSAVLHHALLALAILALAAAAVRVASTVAPRGAERAIAAVVLAGCGAIVEALALGLVGLGASTVALAATAVLTWGAALALLPAPEVRAAAELSHWWRSLDRGWRFACAALVGAGLAWIAWQLRHPSIGYDSSIYHYAEVAGWIHNGRPGSILTLSYDLPYGNYPLTDEVALTWAAGISRSFVPLSLWNPAMLVLLGSASFLTARNLDVPRRPAGLATAALVTLPLVIHQLNEPQTDLPALAWLACCAGLCSGAGRRPTLLVPAVLAAGLAIGTKTTPVVMVAVALGVGVYRARRRARALAPWLAVAVVGAFAVGGIWYGRNLVAHGSPVWPFTAAPWGDSTPTFLRLVNTSFLQRPVATLAGRWGTYTGQLAGATVLLAAAPLVLLRGALGVGLSRTLRQHLVMGGTVAILALLAWSIAPGTGLQRTPGLLFPLSWPSSTVRYMLPALAAATVAVALAARAGGVTAAAATVALAAAIIWNLVKDAGLGLPYTPSWRTVIVGAGAGVGLLGVALLARRRRGPRAGHPRMVGGPALPVAIALLAGVVLAPPSDGFVKRHARLAQSTALGRDMVAWFAAQPGFDSGHGAIAFASRGLQAPLAGDHFTHPLVLMPAHAPCSQVRALAHHSAVVVTDPAFLRGLLGDAAYESGRCLAGRRPAYRDSTFTVYRPG